MEKFKSLFSNIFKRSRKKSGREVQAAKFWFFLSLFFFVGLVFVSLSLTFLKMQLDSLAAPKLDSATKLEKLNNANYKLIEEDFLARKEAYMKLQQEKPAVVDPGI